MGPRFCVVFFQLSRIVSGMTNDKSTQHRYEIAAELGLPNETIGQIRQVEDCLFFLVNGAEYSARVTKAGALKKHSVRKD